MRPGNARSSTRPKMSPKAPSGRGTASKAPHLPEDDDDFRSRKRSKRKSSPSDSSEVKKRERMSDSMEQLASEIIENADGESEVKSTFSTRFKGIQKRIEKGEDIPLETVAEQFFKATLDMAIDLLPIAERTYRKTQKEGAMYPLIGLVNKIGELMNDVKMSDDIAGKLVTVRALNHTAFVRVADLLLREKYNLQAAIDGLTTDTTMRKALRRQIDSTIISFGKGMYEHEKLLSQQLTMFLEGDPNYLNPSSGNDDLDNPEARKKKKKKKKTGSKAKSKSKR